MVSAMFRKTTSIARLQSDVPLGLNAHLPRPFNENDV